MTHLLLGSRRAMRRWVAKLGADLHEKQILEVGSGKRSAQGLPYSVSDLFDKSNHVVTSDVIPDYGHALIDVTNMGFNQEFDVILCLNVLEHVYDFHLAIVQLHRALRPGGILLVVVPAFYPLHDEPHDYWRFTEHSLRRLLCSFREVSITHRGPRRYPLSYFVQAMK